VSQNAGTEAFAIATNLIRDDASDVSPGTTDPSGAARETRCHPRSHASSTPGGGPPPGHGRGRDAGSKAFSRSAAHPSRVHPASADVRQDPV